MALWMPLTKNGLANIVSLCSLFPADLKVIGGDTETIVKSKFSYDFIGK
jgi:hypothetical protein